MGLKKLLTGMQMVSLLKSSENLNFFSSSLYLW